MSRRLDRRLVFGLIALAVLVLLTLFVAPRSNRQTSGSTFSRAPDGYGAWYAYMERQGTPVQQWKKPAREFSDASGTGKTFIQIAPIVWGSVNDDWVSKGNNWVVLGTTAPATEAPFSTEQPSAHGNVRIETSRRRKLERDERQILGDQYGAIVWENRRGKGKVIYAIPSFLAANAYQDAPGNFAFLAKLATQNGNNIWVDEYIHGYKDEEVVQREGTGSWSDYLIKTPLFPILIQVGIGLLVLIWANNRRFGPPMPLKGPSRDDSEAYIQALASVLRKAGRSEFVVGAVGREEQLQIQRSLGLGNTLLERETLINAWVDQTGRSTEEIAQILLNSQKRLSEPELATWIARVQQVRQQLPK
jgi:hypothetical protein